MNQSDINKAHNQSVQIKALPTEQEDWTRLEKYELIFKQKILGLFQFIFSGGLATIGYFLQNIYPCSANQTLFITAIIISAYVLVVLYWVFSDSYIIMQNKNEKWYNSSNNFLPSFVFMFSMLFAIALFVLCVNILIYKDYVDYYFTANYSEVEMKKFQDFFYFLIQFLYLAIFLNIICLLYNMYSSYVFCNSANSMRIILYTFTFLSILLSCCLIWTTSSAQNLENTKALQQIARFWEIKMILYISAIFLIIFLVILVINFLKWKIGFLSIGTLLLLLCFVLISFNGKVYRNSMEITDFVSANCGNKMQLVHQDYLNLVGCPHKYIPQQANQMYPDCEKDKQAIQWEKDVGLLNTQKINTVQCLNDKCCGLVAKVYSDWFYLIVTEAITLFLFCFVIVGCCYYLSSRYAGDKLLSKKVEILIFLLSVGAIVGCFFLVTQFLNHPIKEKPGIITTLQEPDVNSPDYQNYQFNDVTVKVKCDRMFEYYYNMYYKKNFQQNEAFQCADNCNNVTIRVSLLTTQFDIAVKQGYKQDQIKIYDQQFSNLFIDTTLNKDQRFLAAEGNPKDLLDFFEKYVCLNSQFFQGNHNLDVKITKIQQNGKKTLLKKYFNKKKNASLIKNSLLIQQFSPTQQQNIDKTLHFQTLQLQVKDYQTDQNIENQLIQVQIYLDETECILQDQNPIIEQNQKSSLIQINNLQMTTFTIFVKSKGYVYSCMQVSLTNNQQPIIKKTIYLYKRLQQGEARLILQWNDQSAAKLDLFSILNTDSKTDCLVGYLNQNCPNIQFEPQRSVKNIQSIKIEKLGANNYLVFVKQDISLKQFQILQNSGIQQINKLLYQSGANVKMYIGGIDYPVFQNNILSSENNSNIENESNLAWIVGCLNGQTGNEIKSVDKWWVLNSEYQYIIKQENQNFPQAEICEKYNKEQK